MIPLGLAGFLIFKPTPPPLPSQKVNTYNDIQTSVCTCDIRDHMNIQDFCVLQTLEVLQIMKLKTTLRCMLLKHGPSAPLTRTWSSSEMSDLDQPFNVTEVNILANISASFNKFDIWRERAWMQKTGDLIYLSRSQRQIEQFRLKTRVNQI